MKEDCHWCNDNDMAINLDETKCLLVGSYWRGNSTQKLMEKNLKMLICKTSRHKQMGIGYPGRNRLKVSVVIYIHQSSQ